MGSRSFYLIIAIGYLFTSCKIEGDLEKPAGKNRAPAVEDSGDSTKNPILEKPKTTIPESESSITPVDDTVPNVIPSPGEQPPENEEEPAAAHKSEGCSAATPLAEGTIEFSQGALKRTYIVRKPAGYSADKAWPLILALHPNGGNTSYWDATTGNRAIRKIFGEKALIVIAQARNGDWRGDLPVELAYFDTLLTHVKSNLCVDTRKIFSMGFSGGGSFSGVLGCHRKDIRAFASGGGVQYFEAKNCVGTPAAWITIGDKESNAGRTDYRDFWRKHNSCAVGSTKSEPATCSQYTCPNVDRLTEFCSHAGDHAWPDFGAQAAWTFFSRFIGP